MYPINKAFLIILVSLVLHLMVLMVDVSTRPILPSERPLGIGLVQRPLTQFSGLASSGRVESLPDALQSTIAPVTKKIVPVIRQQLRQVEVQVPKVKLKSGGALIVKKKPQPQTISVAKFFSAPLVEETLELPAEVQPASVRNSQVHVAEDDSNALELEKSAKGEGRSADKSIVASAGGAGSNRTLAAGNKGFQNALPRYNLNPRPLYPEVARRRGQQGTVVLKVLVSADGTVDRAALMQSSDHRSLDRAAQKAIYRWQFKPATLLGVPVSSEVAVPIDFILTEN